jgi:hypothetical protein
MSTEDLRRAAPSIFAVEPYFKMSQRYAFIPTIEVVEKMQREGFFPVKADQSRCRIEGKSAFTKHMIRFRHSDHLSDSLQAVGVEIPEIVLVNSHDGKSGYQIHAGLFRLVCANSMVSAGATFNSINVRHSGNITDDVIEGSFKIINEIPALMNAMDEMKAVDLDRTEQIKFSRAAIEIRYPSDEQGNSTAPFNPEQLLAPRRNYYGDESKPNLWNTFNNVQENYMKGGLRGIGRTGRRTTTRAIKSVNADLATNRALWILAESMKELKAA